MGASCPPSPPNAAISGCLTRHAVPAFSWCGSSKGWRKGCDETTGNGTFHVDSLLDLVHRLHGWDLEAEAVRIATFSLYVALMEEADPDDVRGRIRQGQLLPPLFGRTLCPRDCFAEEVNDTGFTLVLGNPPWVSRRHEATASADRWRETRDGVPPFPGGELAWGFAWRSLELVGPGGLVGFLLPAMGFLLNRTKAADETRRAWLREVAIQRVINLSDLRFQLFEGAIRPAIICLFRRAEDRVANYHFDYWCPKVDRHLPSTGVVTLPSVDRSRLQRASVIDEPATWKRHMWMRNPEAKLFQWLGTLPRLQDKLATYRQSKTRPSLRRPSRGSSAKDFSLPRRQSSRTMTSSLKPATWYEISRIWGVFRNGYSPTSSGSPSVRLCFGAVVSSAASRDLTCSFRKARWPPRAASKPRTSKRA